MFLPSHTTARRYEFAEKLTLVRGHHTMRTGFYELIRGNNTTSDTFFAGRFEFLDLPGIVLSNCLQIPSAPIAQGGCGLPDSVASASISTLQSWSLGAPAFYEQGFGDPHYVSTRPFTAGYWQDAWQLRRGFTLNYGLRYELDSQYGPLNTYKKNFAPRLSFAWDPFNDHKTVVRGGYGIFYSPVYFQIPAVVKTLGNVNGVRQIANTLVTIQGAPPANSAEIFGSMFAQGKILCGTPPAGANSCITQSDLAPFVPVSNTGSPPYGTVLFSGQPNYTYSKAIDDSTDFNSDYAAFNELNLRAERARSDFDQRHKVVIAAVMQSRWEHSRILSGFELSPIVTYNSGHPFNLLAGADINGDNHFTNDRPPGAPRNSGIGPNYAVFDMRLGRTLKLGERRALRFTAEGFNITNRTNFSRVNNIVRAAFAPPFNVHGTATLSPSQPLGFTAALPKREVQLGVRFDF